MSEKLKTKTNPKPKVSLNVTRVVLKMNFFPFSYLRTEASWIRWQMSGSTKLNQTFFVDLLPSNKLQHALFFIKFSMKLSHSCQILYILSQYSSIQYRFWRSSVTLSRLVTDPCWRLSWSGRPTDNAFLTATASKIISYVGWKSITYKKTLM